MQIQMRRRHHVVLAVNRARARSDLGKPLAPTGTSWLHEGRRHVGKHSSATMPGACSGGREALWHRKRKSCCAQKHPGGRNHLNVENSRAGFIIYGEAGFSSYDGATRETPS